MVWTPTMSRDIGDNRSDLAETTIGLNTRAHEPNHDRVDQHITT
jgi:hypothetical protein